MKKVEAMANKLIRTCQLRQLAVEEKTKNLLGSEKREKRDDKKEGCH